MFDAVIYYSGFNELPIVDLPGTIVESAVGGIVVYDREGPVGGITAELDALQRDVITRHGEIEQIHEHIEEDVDQVNLDLQLIQQLKQDVSGLAQNTADDRRQTGEDRAAAEGAAENTRLAAIAVVEDLTTVHQLKQATDDNASATAADRVATGQDRTATADDRRQTGEDRVATATHLADIEVLKQTTDNNATATADDRRQTGEDRTATAEDRVQTGEDATATAADRVVVREDRVQVDLDKKAVAEDLAEVKNLKFATGEDRTTTGQDRAAAAASAANAAGSEAEAADRAAETAADRVATQQHVQDAGTFAGIAEDRSSVAAAAVVTVIEQAGIVADNTNQVALDKVAVAADKQQVSEDRAAVAADKQASATSSGLAKEAELKAEAWASAPLNQEVEPGEFSAKHWAEMAHINAGGGVTSVGLEVPSSLTTTEAITTFGVITIDHAEGYQGYTTVEALRLASIADGATKNLPDADLLSRSNHTGKQAMNTIEGLEAAFISVDNNLAEKATFEQGQKADTAVQGITAGTNITVTKTGTNYTINATSSPQKQTDWNATSGVTSILNRPDLSVYQVKSERNTPLGYAGIGADGKIDQSLLPAIAIIDRFPVSSEAEMLSLVAERGDIAIRSDIKKTFILGDGPASDLSNWAEILSPDSGVQSVGIIVPADLVASAPITTSGSITINRAPGYEPYTTAEKNKLAGIPSNATSNTGTVTSVSVSVPTGFSVSGAITTTGTITIGYANGYQGFTTAQSNKLNALPANADQTNISTVGATLAAPTPTNIISDGDKFGGILSGGAVLATWSWATVKAAIKLFTDTLYATVAQGAKADTAVQPGDLTKAAVGLDKVANTADNEKTVKAFIVSDTRSVVSVPNAVPARSGLFEFKYNSSIGSPPHPASSSYTYVLTVNGWTADGTGGWPVQLGFGSELMLRKGSSATTWGDWKTFYTDENLVEATTVKSGLMSAGDKIALGNKLDKDNGTGIGGYTSTSINDGVQSGGTYTPAPTDSNFREIINGGNFTLAAPTTAGSYNLTIDVTNNASAGAITFTGFVADNPKGDDLTATDGHKFKLHISKTSVGVTAQIEALQ